MSSTDAFSAKQYIQVLRSEFQRQEVHGLAVGRFSSFVRTQQTRISHQPQARAQTADYLLNSVGFKVELPQWEEIVEHFGKHLRWLSAASEKTDGVTPIDHLNPLQRQQVVDTFFVDYVRRAANWGQHLSDDTLESLPVFVPKIVERPEPAG